jgi:chromosome partitioning protein
VGSTRVIAVVNQKGGVGKSTTAVNLGAALAETGKKVLVIDLDPQGNASTGMGIDQGNRAITTYQILTAEVTPREAILETAVAGLWAIPSSIDLAGAEIELVSQFARETRLRRSIEELVGSFDFIFLDCPPSLGLLSVNALTAADELIVPIQCEYYALEGLGQLLRNVRLVQQNLNPRLRLSGIVLTMYDPRTRLAEQVVAEVRRYFGARVYDTVIPRTVRLSEAPGFGLPITHYDKKSKGATAYRKLAGEVAERPVSGEPLPLEEPPRMVIPRAHPAPDEAEEGEWAESPRPQAAEPVAGRPRDSETTPRDQAPGGEEPAQSAPAQGPQSPAEQESAEGGGADAPAEEPQNTELAEQPGEPQGQAEAPGGGFDEPEREGLGGPADAGERTDRSGAEDLEDRSRWRLFRRKQGGEP